MINSAFDESSATSPSWAASATSPLLENYDVQDKKGHKLFFFCCDSRRATIIVNIISMIVFIACLIAALVPGRIRVSDQSLVTMFFNIIFTIVILFGAYKWHYIAVLIGLLWEVFILTFWIVGASESMKNTWNQYDNSEKNSTIAFVIISIIWQFVVIYAEAIFVYESKSGIMAPDTYEREEYSCCCFNDKGESVNSSDAKRDEQQNPDIV